MSSSLAAGSSSSSSPSAADSAAAASAHPHDATAKDAVPLPPSLLLSLPTSPAMMVLEALHLRHARRFTVMTSKAIRDAYREPLSIHWNSKKLRSAVSIRFRQFKPAIAFYDGPHEYHAQPWSDRYPLAYQACKERVARMLEEAGLQGTEWKWEGTSRSVSDLKVAMPAGWTKGKWSFARAGPILEAIYCDVCARRSGKFQCAACGKLLCKDCSKRCRGVDARACGFAMCRSDYETASAAATDDAKEGPREEKKEDVPTLCKDVPEWARLEYKVKVGLCPHHLAVVEEESSSMSDYSDYSDDSDWDDEA